jgi:phosphatidate cytidylyltransferase
LFSERELRTVISSPLANPLFWPTAQTLGAVLGGGLALLLVIERHHLGELRHRVLFQRWLVWAVIAPVYSLAVLGGWLTMLLLVSLMVWQALREYCHLIGLPPLYRNVLLSMGLGIGALAVWSPEAFFGALPLLLILGTLQPLLTQDVRAGMSRLAFAALGFGYLPLLLDHLLLIHTQVPGGPGLLLALGLGVALSDVGAFTIGKLFGRHRLSPLVSPNKTWEGVIGNLLGAGIGIAVMSFALPTRETQIAAIVLPVVVAVGAVWGDLVESLLKREFGAKDAGQWLPGFGGLLDRVDSLIVVAPLTYHLMRALS